MNPSAIWSFAENTAVNVAGSTSWPTAWPESADQSPLTTGNGCAPASDSASR